MQLGLHGKEVAAVGEAGQQEEPGALPACTSGRCGRRAAVRGGGGARPQQPTGSPTAVPGPGLSWW